MAQGRCQRTGCTVSDSGICLLSHTPPTACPNFEPTSEIPTPDERLPEEPPDGPASAQTIPMARSQRVFHTGLELGSDDTLMVSRASYCHLVGILGATDAGKTCYLLSLYLKAARGELPDGHQFAGSLTLKGFEERARLLRSWEGGPLPTRLAEHTSLSDSRQAALLHLGLRQGNRGRRVDLLLTDLPGEWSRTLVDSAATAGRFEFLKRADGILLVVDGEALTTSRRLVELRRTKHLMERLRGNVGIAATTPLTILISKGDKIQMQRPPAIDELLGHAAGLGLDADAVLTAAFSYDPEVPSGTGVFEALQRIIQSRSAVGPPVAAPYSAGGRRISAFGRATR